MTLLRLPPSVYENSFFSFSDSLDAPNDGSDICIDMKHCRFTTPAMIVLLLAKIHGWLGSGRNVGLLNLRECAALQYFQRMDFFTHCGIDLDEEFCRRDPRRRFVPVRRVDRSRAGEIGNLSIEVADCILPEMADIDDPEQTGLHDTVSYAVSELALNVVQHSQSDGFVHAQVYPATGIVRLAIADFGIGIRRSFEISDSPHWHESMSDVEAIRKAIEPLVSSKNHRVGGWGAPVNAGVGLTLLAEIAKSTGGDFCVISGRGFHRSGQSDRILKEGSAVRGTLSAIAIPQNNLKNFAATIEEAQRRAGLQGADDYSGMFS